MKRISYLLDTSILIPLIRNEPAIHRRFPENALLYASAIAFGELYYGAERSINVTKSLLEVQEAKKRVDILYVSDEIAKVYGRLRHEQNKKDKCFLQTTFGLLPLQSNMD